MVGSSLQRGSNIKVIVRGGEKPSHKCTGTTNNQIGSIFPHQIKKRENHSLSDRQGISVLPFANETNKERTLDQIKQSDLALSSKLQYVFRSRIAAFSTKYISIQEIMKKNQTSQSDFFIPKFFNGFLTTSFSDNSSVCSSSMPSTNYTLFQYNIFRERMQWYKTGTLVFQIHSVLFQECF